MPSLKDLAKECGVSVATVSKALNDQPDIAAATRERIRAAARRMGYLPNAAARALKTNRTYNLGVLFVDERQSGLTHEYFSAVLDSFKVEAEKRGYDITFINHNISGRSNRMAVLSDNVRVSKLWSSRHGPADTGASLLSTAKRPRSLKTASPAFIRPVKNWGWRYRKSTSATACITMSSAVQKRPGRCWHCRSGPPASSSRMISPHWAAITLWQKRG